MPDDVLQNVTENVNETKTKQEGDESCIDATLHHVEEDMPRFAEEPTHLYTALIDLMKQEAFLRLLEHCLSQKQS